MLNTSSSATVERFTAIIKSIARGFTTDSETQKDLIQEGYLKVFNYTKQDGADFNSEDWRRKVCVSIKRCMIDYMRKQNRRVGKPYESEEVSVDLTPSQESSQFENSISKKTIEKLKRSLPDLEFRILQEAVSPSEEFVFWLKKRRAIYRCFYSARQQVQNLYLDPAIGDFLGIDQNVFAGCVEEIKKRAYHVFAID